MLNTDLLNSVIARFDVPIEAGRVALFRKAIGETPEEIVNNIKGPLTCLVFSNHFVLRR